MNLENYIKNNREQLDTEKPNTEAIWKNIEKSVNIKKRNYWLMSVKVAASIILLVGFSVLLHQLASIHNNQQLILAKIDDTLAKQEADYQKQIKKYYKILQTTNYNKSDLITTLDEVKYIDDLIQKYSEDLQKYGANEELIKSLMDLYQKKIMILNRILNEIERSKQDENRITEI